MENTKPMIYIVEDDNNIRKLVTYSLNSNGYEAVGFPRSEEFWQAISEKLPILIVLDIMLPGEDGMSILSKLKSGSNTKNIPVVMMTAKDSEYDKVLGLDSGADDYISKPFGIMEFTSRIKAVLRRYGAHSAAGTGNKFTVGSLYVDADRHIAKVDGAGVALSLKEFELLTTLLKSGGSVMTRDRLLNEIWGYSFDGESRTVDVHVGKLRKKLGSAGEYIQTVKGIGYKIGGMEE